MRTIYYAIWPICLVCICIISTGCNQTATMPVSKASTQPEGIKEISVSITEPNGNKYQFSTSYPVRTGANSSVNLHWDGRKFIVKDDSGRERSSHEPAVAYNNKKTVKFMITKKGTVTDNNGTATASITRDHSLHLNVPADL